MYAVRVSAVWGVVYNIEQLLLTITIIYQTITIIYHDILEPIRLF